MTAAELLTVPAVAAPPRRRKRRQTVAVFGGGIAGLTAAHELAERGFDVMVYERRAWGGKARSTVVPGSGAGGRKPLPGEHGWRTFFGFYQNTPDTLSRIPFGSNPNGVLDNLVGAPKVLAARDGGRRDLMIPFGLGEPQHHSAPEVLDLVTGALLELDVPPEGAAHFANRLGVFFSSCDARRLDQWERTTWTDFTGAERFGDDYRKLFVNTLSEVLQASKAGETSALFPGRFWEWFVYNMLGRNSNGDLFRFLDAPTDEAMFDPWLRYLTGLGVHLRNRHEMRRLILRDGRVVGARVRGPRGVSTVRADWFVCALPVERARRAWNRGILRADPHLGRMWDLDTGWMNGVKFFLREETPLTRGVVMHTDSPWVITSVSQAQFWKADIAATYGDGRVRESLSAIVSNWTTPGVLYGKPAEACSPEELVKEIWEQMKRHLNDTGAERLTDDLLLSWDIDPGMLRREGHLISDDPLVLPSVGQHASRPDVITQIPNLLLVGDYLRSDWEVANMEAANYNARRAVVALLEKARSHEQPPATLPPYRPPEWEPFKRIDEDRWRQGQPNILDADDPPEKMRARLRDPSPA